MQKHLVIISSIVLLIIIAYAVSRSIIYTRDARKAVARTKLEADTSRLAMLCLNEAIKKGRFPATAPVKPITSDSTTHLYYIAANLPAAACDHRITIAIGYSSLESLADIVVVTNSAGDTSPIPRKDIAKFLEEEDIKRRKALLLGLSAELVRSITGSMEGSTIP